MVLEYEPERGSCEGRRVKLLLDSWVRRGVVSNASLGIDRSQSTAAPAAWSPSENMGLK